MHIRRLVELLMLLSISWGCASGGRAADVPLSSEAAQDRAEVLQRQNAWIQAGIHGDVRTFGEHMDDSYHRVGPQGRIRNKQQWMESIGAAETTYNTVEYHNLNVHFYGDIAVVSGEYRQRATSGGQDNTGTGVAVHTWIKRDGQWRVLASIYPGTLGATSR